MQQEGGIYEMDLSPKQQIVEAIKNAESILLIGHEKPSGDSLGPLLAFGNILRELGKNPRIVVSSEAPDSLKFLPGIENTEKEIDKARDLVFKVDIEGLVIDKISTKTDGKTLEISITSKEGELNKEKTVVAEGKFKYDCIVVLNTPNVDKVDRVYKENTDLFLETPIINIDHHPGNEYFGTINLVDLNATSTAETLVAIFEALGKSKVDEDTATLLLAGIMADTDSFRKDNTTPKSLTISAQLLAAGARKKEIVDNLYSSNIEKTLVQDKTEEKPEKDDVEKKAEEVSSGQDIISKAIKSLEAAEKDETKESDTVSDEPTPAEDNSGVKVYYEEASLMPIGEILKKFSPQDKAKLEEFKKKNEEVREKLKKKNIE